MTRKKINLTKINFYNSICHKNVSVDFTIHAKSKIATHKKISAFPRPLLWRNDIYTAQGKK